MSESELEPSSSNADEEDLSDYIPAHRQPTKPVIAKIDAAKRLALLDKQNTGVEIPRKAELANDVPEAPEVPKVEAAIVEMQAAPAKQERRKPGPRLAAAPPFAPKVDKAKRVNPKLAAPPLAPEHPTRTIELSNEVVPPPKLGFQALY